jgi:prepilin-type N-terminal cleavage/methylation domain-containing protein
MTASQSKSGFTLVELLVVTGLLAVFMGLLVTGLRPNQSSQIRRAAENFASVLLATQTAAMKSETGAAVILRPSGAANQVCVDIFYGEMPPYILAETAAATAFPITTSTSGSAAVQLEATNATSADLSSAYKIQFGGTRIGNSPATATTQTPSPWYAVLSAVVSGSFATLSVGMRGNNGQAPENTLWPANVLGGSGNPAPLYARAARNPSLGARAMEMPKAAGMDLRFSGTGDAVMTDWFGSMGGNNPSGSAPIGGSPRNAIGIVFNQTGSVDALIQDVLNEGGSQPTPQQPAGPIFFLFAGREEIVPKTIGDPETALSGTDYVWVVLDPKTGKTHLSSVVPQTFRFADSNGNITDWAQGGGGTARIDAAARASRAKARLGVPIGK